ncbi:MAG TPA: MerR family transcriptional regulator [Burkholderiaceae bacterium]
MDRTIASAPPPPSFHIGALADRSGRSIHTIRWYETQGLIPGVARDAGGRRVYVEQHVGWLQLMERLRRTGMSIAEMRAYTKLVKAGRSTLRERRDMLAAHRERVQAAIAEQRAALKLIAAKVDFYDEWIATGHRPKNDPNRRAAARRA